MRKGVSSQDYLLGWHTIYGRDGRHHTPYMTRLWIGRLRLHIFHRGDQDEDCHDHPWNFWTFPLNSYLEEVVDPYVADQVRDGLAPVSAVTRLPQTYLQVVRAFRLHFRPATHSHRVLGRFSGYSGGQPTFSQRRIVTLVWRSGVERKWGFLKRRDRRWCWVRWREYILEGGKDAPCSGG